MRHPRRESYEKARLERRPRVLKYLLSALEKKEIEFKHRSVIIKYIYFTKDLNKPVSSNFDKNTKSLTNGTR